MERKIIISVPQFGAPKVEAVGFNGEGCTDATAIFEKALSAGPVENREFKPEWQNPNYGGEEEAERLTW